MGFWRGRTSAGLEGSFPFTCVEEDVLVTSPASSIETSLKAENTKLQSQVQSLEEQLCTVQAENTQLRAQVGLLQKQTKTQEVVDSVSCNPCQLCI